MIISQDLTKYFNATCAIDKVSLQVKKKDIFGLVGPDGAGKTTLIRIICGLINPDAGELSILGHSVCNIQEVRNHLGYMPQRFSLYGDLTILENINFFAALYNLDKQIVKNRTNEVLSLTRLLPFKNRLADHLSGGMKQKLALSCALMTRPELLVLDEPTYGVDPESRREFWKMLYHLNQQGMTILISTPYMDESELCTQVAFINNGGIKIQASPVELKKKFPYEVLELYSDKKQLKWLASIPEILDISFFGYKYRLIVKHIDSVQSIRKIAAAHGVSDIRLVKVAPTMEDIFVILAEQED